MSTKKKTRWFSFDFDGTGDSSSAKGKRKSSDFRFFERLEPRSVDELAVHSKKVKELEGWLRLRVVDATKQKTSPILLITGPTGCGKTTTLKVLCKTLGVDVQEWVNPVDQDNETFRGPGQVARLREFLSESRYPSLLTKTSAAKKISLIEDFPNSLLGKPDVLEGILESCVAGGKAAVVFICTDASKNGLNLSKSLFTDEIKLKFRVETISFNASSTTMLKSAIKRAQQIVLSESDSYKVPSAATVDAIVASSMGDIRCAVNQFCFASLQGTANIPLELTRPKKPSLPTKRKRSDNSSSTIKVMSKDESLGLFHSIGRVLNPKRTDHGTSWRLNYDFDSLIDELSSQPATMAAFLHENYLKYFGDLEEASAAADDLSLAQTLLEKWTDMHDVLLVGIRIAVLGLMVHNGHRVSRWNQICGPRRYDVPVLKPGEVNVFERCYYNVINKNDKYYKFKYR